MQDFTFVVFTRPMAGREDEYNLWYDQRHLPDVLAVPGFTSARRFAADTETGRQYLALYTMRSDDPDACLAELAARANTDRMPLSPALDMESIDAVLYRALGEIRIAG